MEDRSTESTRFDLDRFLRTVWARDMKPVFIPWDEQAAIRRKLIIEAERYGESWNESDVTK